MLGAGLLGLSLPVAALAAAPAGATVHVGAINCDAHAVILPSTDLGHVAVQNPSTSHTIAPEWVAQGAAFNFSTPASMQILPSSAGGQSVDHFSDIATTDQIIGQNVPPAAQGAGDTTITTVSDHAVAGAFWDNNVSDNVPPVPMDGLGTDPPAPHNSVDQGPALLASGGVYYVHTLTSPSPNKLSPSGPIGGAIFSPAASVAVTNAGAQDGPINYIGASTSLNAFVLGGAVEATTTCAPSATPQSVVHIHTAGSPANLTEPVLACAPTAGTAGTLTISKGFWSGPAGQGDPALQAGGSLKSAVTYDGCVVPDQQSDAWVLSKHGAPAAVALTATKAQLSLKGKNFGDCKLVTNRGPGGEVEGGYTNSYQTTGTIGTKFTNSSNVVVKVPGTAAAVTIKYVIDTNNNPIVQPIPEVTLEARGVVTKGMGVGGNVTFVGELDNTNSAVLSVLGCNGIGPAGAPNVFYGALNEPFKTGGDAIFQVDRP
jgi:hypothetical protein